MNMTIGERLKNLRNKKNITQTELAEQLGISQSTYVRYEQDKVKRCRNDVFEKLAEILGSTTNYILGDHYTPDLNHIPSYMRDFIVDPTAAEFLKTAYLEWYKVKVEADLMDIAG